MPKEIAVNTLLPGGVNIVLSAQDTNASQKARKNNVSEGIATRVFHAVSNLASGSLTRGVQAQAGNDSCSLNAARKDFATLCRHIAVGHRRCVIKRYSSPVLLMAPLKNTEALSLLDKVSTIPCLTTTVDLTKAEKQLSLVLASVLDKDERFVITECGPYSVVLLHVNSFALLEAYQRTFDACDLLRGWKEAGEKGTVPWEDKTH